MTARTGPPPPPAPRRGLPSAHHLWYLQVRAPFTSSLMEPASLRSSSRITRGTSPIPVSRSIWLARLERYSCRSCRSGRRGQPSGAAAPGAAPPAPRLPGASAPRPAHLTPDRGGRRHTRRNSGLRSPEPPPEAVAPPPDGAHTEADFHRSGPGRPHPGEPGSGPRVLGCAQRRRDSVQGRATGNTQFRQCPSGKFPASKCRGRGK